MPKPRAIPVVLTIAGSDSGGGAGIQADLKTFAALGVHSASAITCVTAQNPKGVTGIQACEPRMVRQQIEAVFAELPPAAVKTGMLYSEAIIRVASEFFSRGKRPPLVVDPVMVSTSGMRLLKRSAIEVLKAELLPLAALVTPNLEEAGILLGRKLGTPGDLRDAARDIHTQFGCAALVKGGHLRGTREAVDFFYDGRVELMLSAPFARNRRTHGTGCTYSAAITAGLALGHRLPQAVQRAKLHVTRAIYESRPVAGHWVLENF